MELPTSIQSTKAVSAVDASNSPSKSLQKKYDRRIHNAHNFPPVEKRRKSTEKSVLTANMIRTVLKDANSREKWALLLASNDERLRFEVLKYLTDRLEGRPHVAPVPGSNPSDHTVNQFAIRNLQIVNNQQVTKKLRKRLTVNADAAPTIQAAAKPEGGR